MVYITHTVSCMCVRYHMYTYGGVVAAGTESSSLDSKGNLKGGKVERHPNFQTFCFGNGIVAPAHKQSNCGKGFAITRF